MRLKVFTFLILALAIVSFAGLTKAEVPICSVSISSTPVNFTDCASIHISWSSSGCEFVSGNAGAYSITSLSGGEQGYVCSTETSSIQGGYWKCGAGVDQCPDQTQNEQIWSASASASSTKLTTTPTVSLSINAQFGSGSATAAYGTYKVLDWSSTNADSCSALWATSTNTSGGQTVGPITQNTTYSMTCTGAGGSASDSQFISVYSVCGDTYCTGSETNVTCAGDCYTPLCGNGITDTGIGETCDNGANNGVVCTPAYNSPCTYCNLNCQTAYGGTLTCGDGIVTSPPEQCDGTNLNGTSCNSLGYSSGTLTCYPASVVNPSQNCTFNTNNCVPYPSGGSCGDSIVQTGEQCDDGNSSTPAPNNGACPATCSLTCTTNNCVPPVGVCVMTSATWTNFSASSGNIVSLIVDGTNCSGKTVSFKVFEYDAVGTDVPAQNHPVNVVFSSNRATGAWTAEWMDDGLTQGDPEYYFTASVVGSTNKSSGTASGQLLTVSLANVSACASVAACGDYADLTSCTLDACGVVENSVPASIDCSATGTDCYCSWNSGTSYCDAKVDVATNGVDYGSCTVTSNSADTCDDGFLEFSWSGVWTFLPGKGGPADDVNGLQATCVKGGSRSVECPAQIALPFVSTYSIISVLVVIVLVYWALSTRKPKKVKSSGKKKRR